MIDRTLCTNRRAIRTELFRIVKTIAMRNIKIEAMLDEMGPAATEANRTKGDVQLMASIDKRLRKLLETKL